MFNIYTLLDLKCKWFMQYVNILTVYTVIYMLQRLLNLI